MVGGFLWLPGLEPGRAVCACSCFVKAQPAPYAMRLHRRQLNLLVLCVRVTLRWISFCAKHSAHADAE